MGIETYISDLVQLEIREERQSRALQTFIDAGLLMVESLAPNELEKAATMYMKYRISIEEASALILAQKKKAVLLSGDGTLRKTAQTEGIDVHGVIWVFDRLVEKALLIPADAIVKLEEPIFSVV